MSYFSDKKEARRYFLDKRNAISADEIKERSATLCKHILALEEQANPKYVTLDARKSLADAAMPVLIIHSTDDKTVSYKLHFKALETALSHKKNITFLTVTRKGHNPNYTEEAVQYKYKLFADLKKRSKKKLMETAEQKKAFRDAWDWNAVTAQDAKLWQIIFDFLDR